MFRRNVRWTFRRDTYAIDVPGFQGAEPSGKFRNSPKAGSGAEWLATLRNLPVISPPLNRHPPSHIFHPTLSDQNGDDGGFVVQELPVEERDKLPFPQIFAFWNRLVMYHSDAKYRTIMCRIRHSMPFLCLTYAVNYISQSLSVIFSCYFCLSFSESLSGSAERHKNSSHKHFSNS